MGIVRLIGFIFGTICVIGSGFAIRCDDTDAERQLRHVQDAADAARNGLWRDVLGRLEAARFLRMATSFKRFP
jgi:hypothetical protein